MRTTLDPLCIYRAPRWLCSLVALSLILSACGETSPTDGSSSTADTSAGGEDTSKDTGGEDTTGDDASSDATTGECSVDADCEGKITPKDDCHAAVCDSGTCKDMPKAAGAACDDDKQCTSDDVCDADGECNGKVDCPADLCNVGSCANDGSCTQNAIPAAQQEGCDDGNACTENDVCGFGSCNGSAIDVATKCDDDNSCTIDACDPKTGCIHTPKNKGDACNDGDACTDGDTCDDSGVCAAGVKVKCDDGDQCTEDGCDKVKGCVYVAFQNGVTCDDNDKCTEKDECADGKCKGALKPEAQAPNSCLIVSCDPPTGKVATSSAADGKGCSDDDACTVNDICANGICKGKPLVCNDGNPCTIDKCDGKTGQCGAEAVKDGGVCDDGNKCTTKDACLNGKCEGESYVTSKQCDDSNSCTNDGCSPQSGCFHVPKDGGLCSDGDQCTELDKCISGKCQGAKKQCDDNKPCTNDICDPKTGLCKHENFTGPCSDGDACTSGDICTGAKCVGKVVICDDNNSCTQDICDTKTGCKYIPLKGGSPCDDGIGCTLNDQCDLGKCTGTNTCVKCQTDLECAKFDDGNPCNGVARCNQTALGNVCDIDPKSIVICDAYSDPSCGANICNSKSGKCELVKKQQGVPCVSGNKCLADPVCSVDGKCLGKSKDCDDGEVCTIDSCDPTSGCKFAPKPDKEKCDDGNVCTVGEVCTKGVCQSEVNTCKCSTNIDCAKWNDTDLCNGVFTCNSGLCSVDPASVIKCDPSKDQCIENLCNKTTGKCGNIPTKDGTVCDDGSKCTIQEVCTSGKCVSSAKLQCDDGNKCTINVCNPPTGCVSGNVGEGGPCNDGNNCTEKDTCIKGVCSGKKSQCDDGNPCTIDLCDNKTGNCQALLDNKLNCDDGDPCTTNDKCTDGVCKASALKCDDGNPCTVDGCDGKGGCLNKLELNKNCDDNNPCTAFDACNLQGKCLGKAKDCDDGSQCTEDSCINGACVVIAAVGKACDDGNKCTEKDACSNKGVCEASKVNCDDGNVCTKIAGPCSPVNGCTVVPNDGKNCSDGDACTYTDKCKSGACQGTKLNCNDNNLCTIDACDPKTGCANKQNTCDDNNDCTFDKCDQTKGCVHSNLDGFQPCDDGNVCTEKGVCNKSGKCQSQIVICNDDNACTVDDCEQATKDSKGGCVFLADESTATTCTDDDPCTLNSCEKGKCIGAPKDCDDSNPCTSDACVKNKGCQYTDKKNGSTCDDGDACSAESQCNGGFCIAKDKKLCTTCKDSEDCKIVDDNNMCNGGFSCVKDKPTDALGYCVKDVKPVVCDTTSDTSCVKNICDTLTGKCKSSQLVNGSKCDDGIACTAGDACQNGNCLSAGPVDCSTVSDLCNEAGCVEDGTSSTGFSCIPLPKAGTIVCDADGDPCTAFDQCDEGKCKAGKPIDCSGVAGECELSACVKSEGGGFTCKITQAKDGSKCEDGQLCTANDKCKSGKCQPGTDPYDCSGEVDAGCATGVCDKTNNGGTGGCLAQPKNEGGSCNSDDNGCTVGDLCVKGFCVPGVPPDCNPKTGACTVGACKSTSKTTYECVGAPVNESKPCEADNNGCTIDDKCVAGTCKPGKLKDCSSLDGNKGCLVGTCEPLSSSAGKCVSKPSKSGVQCDADGNGCTQNDTCNGKGACQPGTAVNCLKETGGCGQGICKSASATTFECKTDPKPKGTKCDADGDGCTVDDTCDGNGKCLSGKAPDCSAEDKGVCIKGACKNKGSTKFLCEATPVKEGTTCDADKDGCTVNDACNLGFCQPGLLETCKKLNTSCAKAACASESSTAYKCKVTPVVSYPPLTVEVKCSLTAKPGAADACAAGYKCVKPDPNAPKTICIPVATVTCNDGDLCVDQAVCVSGSCKAQTLKDCDDDDPCTLDSCDKGKCLHQKVEGCGKCLNQDFEGTSLDNAVLNTSKKALTIKRVQGGSLTGQWSLQMLWDGSTDKDIGADPSSLSGSVRARRMYLEAGSGHALQFGYKTTASGPNDCLEAYINGESLWKKCGTSAGSLLNGYALAKVDLTKYAGEPIDFEVRMTILYDKSAKGEVRIDDLALYGRCGPGCMGERLEVPIIEEKPKPSLAIPQPWQLQAKAKNFLNWALNDKEGKSGKASLRASWTGGSPDGKSYDATITIPGVQVFADSRLHFALRATTLGEAGCGGDTFTVTANGTVVHQTCDKVATWTVLTIDLKAYAGKTVEFVFKAESGKTKAAAGLVEIDDVSVSGQCSYLCYANSFDSGLGGLLAQAQGAPSFNWKGATDKSVSKPGSAYITHDAKTPAKSQSRLTGEGVVRPIKIPVMGASLEVQANVFMNPKAGVCYLPPNNVDPDPRSAPVVIGAELVMGENPDMPEGYETVVPLMGICSSLSGWGKQTEAFPEWMKGSMITPLVLANREAAVQSLKAYIDDYKIVCK